MRLGSKYEVSQKSPAVVAVIHTETDRRRTGNLGEAKCLAQAHEVIVFWNIMSCTSRNIYQTTRCHILNDSNVNNHLRENLKDTILNS